jgi:hypothetical protein
MLVRRRQASITTCPPLVPPGRQGLASVSFWVNPPFPEERMSDHLKRLVIIVILNLLLSSPAFAVKAEAETFKGFGLSFIAGTGTPTEVDVFEELAINMQVNSKSGNALVGIQGFYQRESYRLGLAASRHSWGGTPIGATTPPEGTVGASATIIGIIGGYSMRRGRLLINLGSVAGEGWVRLDYHQDESHGGFNDGGNALTYYLEPFASLGWIATSWLGIEAHLSAPLFFFRQKLSLTGLETSSQVSGQDVSGISVCIKLTLGKIAGP